MEWPGVVWSGLEHNSINPQIKAIEDCSNAFGLVRTFKIKCNRKECTKSSIEVTPKNECFYGINHVSVLACRLFGKAHAGGKKLLALLNLKKPISKKSMGKTHRLYSKFRRNTQEKSSVKRKNVLIYW